MTCNYSNIDTLPRIPTITIGLNISITETIMSSFGFDPRFSAIAFGGGPCSGKSDILSAAKRLCEDWGMRVACMSEVATGFMDAGFAPRDKWLRDFDFQRHLMVYSLDKEERYYRMLTALDTDKPLVLLCDRGILDGIAYVGRENYLRMCEEFNLNHHALRDRYKAVIHMVTAADGAEEFYSFDNNPYRTEPPEEARALDKRLRDAWKDHRHLFIVDNSTGFEEKKRRALSHFARVLNMPEPLENERWFILDNFERNRLPSDTVMKHIVQDYLVSDDPELERRVRIETVDDHKSYYYAEKRPAGKPGSRHENEPPISKAEYDRLLSNEKDRSLQTIVKTRFIFYINGQKYEVDCFLRPQVSWSAKLECEMADLSAPLTIPRFLGRYKEVTGDERHSSRGIAAGKSPR